MSERDSSGLNEGICIVLSAAVAFASPFLMIALLCQSDKVKREGEQEPPFYIAGTVKDETYDSKTNTRMFSVESYKCLKIFEYEDSSLAQKLDTSMSRGDKVRVEVRPWQERQPNHYYINPHQVQDINGRAPSL